MTELRARCLVLACGNTLRGDDGVGPFLAQWVEERFAAEPGVRVVNRQQWTADLAADLAEVETALFIDCSAESPPGQVMLFPVEPAAEQPRLYTHHLGAPELLAMESDLFGSLPRQAQLLTVGGGSFELSESFSAEVEAALPEARRLIEESVCQMLGIAPA
jgi:hydrogenase maturation protease